MIEDTNTNFQFFTSKVDKFKDFFQATAYSKHLKLITYA